MERQRDQSRKEARQAQAEAKQALAERDEATRLKELALIAQARLKPMRLLRAKKPQPRWHVRKPLMQLAPRRR